jgi:hypothetical protein
LFYLPSISSPFSIKHNQGETTYEDTASAHVLATVRNGGLEFQFDEVVRAKEDRRRMDAGDCECCRDVSFHFMHQLSHQADMTTIKSTTLRLARSLINCKHRYGGPHLPAPPSPRDLVHCTAAMVPVQHTVPEKEKRMQRSPLTSRQSHGTGTTGSAHARRLGIGILGSRTRRRRRISMSGRGRCIDGREKGWRVR